MSTLPQILQTAVEHHQAGRLGEAEKAYLAVLDSHAELGDAHFLFGLLAFQTNRLELALGHLEKAVRLEPANPKYLSQLAMTLKALRRVDEALSVFDMCLKNDPANLQALISAADLQLGLGNRALAAQYVERASQFRNSPGFPHYSFGWLLSNFGLKEDARIHFQICLDQDPQDRQGVKLLLAALGAEQLPERASDALLEDMYDKRAMQWDSQAARSGGYRGHELVADALRRFGRRDLQILDAGCGTGLVGMLVRDMAARMEGVDISAAMLEQAKKKDVYDALFEEDLAGFMRRHAGSYDAVLSAATLIHFGDLRPVFAATAAALRDAGLFIFTVFPSTEGDVQAGKLDGLAQGGCYLHSRAYIDRTARQAGFSTVFMEDHIHEHKQGVPVTGLLICLERRLRQP